jgi:hypothetical protein
MLLTTRNVLLIKHALARAFKTISVAKTMRGVGIL